MAICLHAAAETGQGLAEVGTHAVVLSVASEDELLVLSQKLTSRQVEHHMVREDWAPYFGACMAIGIPPGPRQKVLGGIALWR